jgi:glycine cleavage system protein P-like pyridoxal-binding family
VLAKENPRTVPSGSGGRQKPDGTYALDHNRPKSVGRVRAFAGNFGVLLRALAYTLAYGPGIRQATEDAVLNANYIRKNLEPYFDLPYNLPSMHEVVFSDARQKSERRKHHGHRQAPHRLRLSPVHHGVSRSSFRAR